MFRILRICLLLASLLMAAETVARDTTSGSSLWTGCSAEFDSQTFYESYAACRAYVIGLADVMSGADSIAGRRACIPDATSKADITERVIGWLRANPARRGELPAHILVAEAIATAFPCQ